MAKTDWKREAERRQSRIRRLTFERETAQNLKAAVESAAKMLRNQARLLETAG